MNIYLNGLKINRRQRRHMFIEERMNQKLFDPGRGRTLFLHRPFYKHANPPGWNPQNECIETDAGGITYL